MNARVILRLVAMNVMNTLEYRGAFFVYMVNTVATSLISLLVWLAVSGQGTRLPYGRSQLVTYFLLVSVVAILTGAWPALYLAENIRLGGLSPWLLRPTPYIAHDIGNNIGEKLVKMPLLLPLVGLAALVFRADLRLPADPWAWLLFALSLPMAAVVAFLVEFLIGSLAFWVQDVQGLIRVEELIGEILNGRVVPLALFPHSVSGFLEAQPFRYTLSFPLEVLMGRLAPAALARGFAWQAFYCVALWACYRLLWRYGLRSYSAAGA